MLGTFFFIQLMGKIIFTVCTLVQIYQILHVGLSLSNWQTTESHYDCKLTWVDWYQYIILISQPVCKLCMYMYFITVPSFVRLEGSLMYTCTLMPKYLPSYVNWAFNGACAIALLAGPHAPKPPTNTQSMIANALWDEGPRSSVYSVKLVGRSVLTSVESSICPVSGRFTRLTWWTPSITYQVLVETLNNGILVVFRLNSELLHYIKDCIACLG